MSVRALAIALSLSPLTALAQTSDVIVTATPERMSDWRRAETRHAVVYSDGSEADLIRIAHTLERLHQLLDRLYRGDASADDTIPLRVVLLAKADGPLMPETGTVPGVGRRRYIARDDGPVLIVERRDQAVDLNTRLRFQDDCDELIQDGNAPPCAPVVRFYLPVIRPWEAVVYADYARHFILSHRPAAYPSWYLDGVGALFSTISVRADGAIDYADAPTGYRAVLQSYGDLDTAKILGGAGAAARNDALWTPYHVWLLAHFFLFSDAGAAWQDSFHRYMAAIHQGQSPADAAAAFGDLRKLQRAVVRYARGATAFARSTDAPKEAIDPLVTRLSEGGAELLKVQLAIATGGASPDVGRLPQTADAAALRAETACRAGRAKECLAAAERALELAPDQIAASTWKGAALTDLAVAGPPEHRAEALATARKALERAIEIDAQAPAPRVALFSSYVAAGQIVPDAVIANMAAVVRKVPTAPHPRLILGEELIRQGKLDLGRRALQSVVNGPDDSIERRTAVAMLQTLPPSR